MTQIYTSTAPDFSSFRKLLLQAALFLLPLLFFLPQAHAADYSVCASGCDQPTLSAALQIPGLGAGDTLNIDSTYTFVPADEDNSGNFPSGVTVICAAGAGAIGDQSDAIFSTTGGSDITIQNCTFENVNLDFTGSNNLHIEHNTFTPAAFSEIILTNASDVHITDNTLQKVQIQTADDITITGNTFECRFDNTCLFVGTAGTPDFSLDSDISNNVLVQNNTFNNYLATNGGDWINVNGGRDIQFLNNRVQSAITLNDTYLTMINISNAQVDFKYNYVIAPIKIAPQTAATIAFNIRTSDYDTNVLYEHNTVIQRNGNTPGANQNSCIYLFDGGGHANIPMNITARYNLCDQDGTTAAGEGIGLSYSLGSSFVTVTDSFNGFSNMARTINDSTGTITSLNANTVLRKALLRRENVDTSDDEQPSPVSVYLDADGTTDIGAFSGVRSTQIFIDDNCVVDYITCHSQSTNIISDAIKPGDTVALAAGTYPSFDIQNIDNVTITGAGDSTIIDAAGGSFGLQLTNVTNSHISGLLIKNATTNSSSYTLTTDSFSTALHDYNSFGPFALFLEAGCNANPVFANTPTDMTNRTGIGTENMNFFIVQIDNSPSPNSFISIIAPTSIAADAAGLVAQCGVPLSFIDAAVIPGLALDGNGNYTFNSLGMTAAGMFMTNGSPDTTLVHNTTNAAALILTGSTGNTFTGIKATDSRRGVEFRTTSAGNSFVQSDLSGNAISDVYVSGSGANTLDDTVFNRSTTQIPGTGSVTVRYSTQVLVKNRTTDAPIEGATVTITDLVSAAQAPLTTDSSGLTPLTTPLIAMILNNTYPNTIGAGSKNPYTISASKDGFTNASIVANLDEPFKNFTVTLPPIAAAGPSSFSGGGGGGFSAPSTETTPPSNANTNSNVIVPQGNDNTNGVHSAAGLNPQQLLENFPGFPDLPKSDPAYIAFAYSYAIGAFVGDADGKLNPQLLLQRDQIAKLVAVSIYHIDTSLDYCDGKAPFPDVQRDQWAVQYICFAKNHGVLTGYKGNGDIGMFRPERTVSRAELVAILTRALPDMMKQDKTGNYSDVLPGPWYVAYAAVAHALQLFPINSPLDAERSVRRVEAARILYSLHLQGFIE